MYKGVKIGGYLVTDADRLDAISACGAFDEALTDGRMTAPSPGRPESIRIRDLLGWCESTGRDPATLTDAEIRRFASDPVVRRR